MRGGAKGLDRGLATTAPELAHENNQELCQLKALRRLPTDTL
jgi:hypothetical protein